jgi:hypothetical protein
MAGGVCTGESCRGTWCHPPVTQRHLDIHRRIRVALEEGAGREATVNLCWQAQ